jgi:signal transduction histidine kinase
MITNNFRTSGKPGRVLVVDDQAANCELITALLEPRGFVVEVAMSGPQGLECIAAAPPDVVLLDVSMPIMDGLEVCRRLKGDPKTAMLPVIMVTGNVNRNDRLAGISAGANDYLPKPIDAQDLILRVRNAVFAKRLHDELAENYRRLQELERLRDSLTHMVVHDLRSPLTAIIMSMELMKMTTAGRLKPRDLETLEACHGSALNMNEMVTTLLDVSRLEAGELPLQKAVIPLAPVVQAAVIPLRGLAEGNDVRLAGPDGDGTAHCDGEIVRRVLGNLVGNALKFTPAGGEVRVSLHNGGPDVRVAVRDNGPGIAPEYHGKIFEKFGQVQDRKAKLGAGLGLAFCKLAVEAHGGRIGVESEVGRGSIFWFTLPSVSEPGRIPP